MSPDGHSLAAGWAGYNSQFSADATRPGPQAEPAERELIEQPRSTQDSVKRVDHHKRAGMIEVWLQKLQSP
jgi:hypothetical protein